MRGLLLQKEFAHTGVMGELAPYLRRKFAIPAPPPHPFCRACTLIPLISVLNIATRIYIFHWFILFKESYQLAHLCIVIRFETFSGIRDATHKNGALDKRVLFLGSNTAIFIFASLLNRDQLFKKNARRRLKSFLEPFCIQNGQNSVEF